MSDTQTEHETGIQIIQAFNEILGGLQGTRLEHEQRVNSLQFLLNRITKLDELERASSETQEAE